MRFTESKTLFGLLLFLGTWNTLEGSPDYLQPDVYDLEKDLNPRALQTFRHKAERQQQFHIPHYEAIVKNLTSVNGDGLWPSHLSMFGKNMFPVVTDGENNVVIAGGLYGKGRIFICGHAGFVLSQTSDPGLKQLTQNAIKWLAKTDKLEGIRLAVVNRDSVGQIDATYDVKPKDLNVSKYQVYFTTMYEGFDHMSIKSILKYVKDGGGLIVGGQIWGWYLDNGGEINGLNNLGNRLLKRFGVMMGEHCGAASTFTSSLQKNLFYAFDSIQCPDGTESAVSSEAASTISRIGGLTLNINTSGDPDFKEIFKQGLRVFNCLTSVNDKAFVCRMVASFLPVVLLQKPSSIFKAKDHESFPGKVPDNAVRVTEKITVNGTYAGYPGGFLYANAGSSLMVSTGLYAPAGSIIKVVIEASFLKTLPKPSNLEVQIGCHSDHIYHKPEAPRSPQIVTSIAINGRETIAANPWGGLVYIRVPWGARYPMFNVTISNVVKAPYFVKGKHSAEDWKAMIREYPAPWGELEVQDQIIFTVPSTALRNYSSEEQLLTVYKEIMSQYNFLQGFEGDFRFRAERIVLDIEISAGWMHAGYPVMGYMYYAPYMIDPQSALSGQVWGEYHELGHNSQWHRYTTGATTESGCNVYAHYVNKKMFNETSRFVQSRTDAFLAGFLLDGKIGYGGQVAVLSYTLLLDRYGFQHWRNMNRFYMQHPDQVNGEAYDVFTRVMANVTRMDVCPFYQFFGYSLTEQTLTACKEQPPMPDLIIDRYNPVLADPPTPVGTCPSGWLQHGASCLIVSNNQRVTWDKADQVCQALNPKSHLASCFTEEEAFYLTRHFWKNKIQGSYHVGIDENNPENVAKYLDGSVLPSLLPWQEFRPAKDSNRCTIMQDGWLYDVECHTNAGVICKTGPTSCGPKSKCPEGWTRFMDKCYWMFFDGVHYDNALADCKSKGAQLLEINSQEENYFFDTWVKEVRWSEQYYWRNYWLGMENITSGIWNSGDPMTFSRFCDEMDLSARTGTLASLADNYCWGGIGKWNNEAYICEKQTEAN